MLGIRNDLHFVFMFLEKQTLLFPPLYIIIFSSIVNKSRHICMLDLLIFIRILYFPKLSPDLSILANAMHPHYIQDKVTR